MTFFETFKFNVLAFMTALCVGLIYTYYTSSSPKIVIKWPTPYNAGNLVYKDDSNVCYKYQIKKVKCPASNKNIKDFKIQ